KNSKKNETCLMVQRRNLRKCHVEKSKSLRSEKRKQKKKRFKHREPRKKQIDEQKRRKPAQTNIGSHPKLNVRSVRKPRKGSRKFVSNISRRNRKNRTIEDMTDHMT